jgi:hypothetical protein
MMGRGRESRKRVEGGKGDTAPAVVEKTIVMTVTTQITIAFVTIAAKLV